VFTCVCKQVFNGMLNKMLLVECAAGSHDGPNHVRIGLHQQHTHCGADDPHPHLMG
jgi:hypothetical protein